MFYFTSNRVFDGENAVYKNKKTPVEYNNLSFRNKFVAVAVAADTVCPRPREITQPRKAFIAGYGS